MMKLWKLTVLLMVVAAAAFMACGQEEPADEAADEETDPAADASVEETVENGSDAEMTEEEKLAFVMENCVCPQCPSWIPEASEKGEGGYCLTGASQCIVVEAGCICPDCPVTSEMGLQWGYYCTRGSVEELMAAEENAAAPE